MTHDGPDGSTSPRVLIVTDIFARPSGQPWLMDDLALALAEQGARVDVLVFESRDPRPRTGWVEIAPGVRYMSLGLDHERVGGAVGGALARGTNVYRMHTAAWRAVRHERYDIGVFTSIGVVSGGFPSRLRKHGVVSHLSYILWDFFPRHHREIGRLHGAATLLEAPLKLLERASFARADSIVLMSEANEEFLREYHRGVDAAIVISPPWARDGGDVAGRPAARPDTPFTVVCGGQLTHGRGIETLMDTAEILTSTGDDDIVIDVYGWGPDSDRLKAEAARRRLINLHIRDGLPRAEYRAVLLRAHAGVTVNVAGVTIPTFPTKISDYCLAGLPVIACLESSTDAGRLIEESGAGISVPVDSPEQIAEAIRTIRAEWRSGAWASRSAASTELHRVHLSDTAVAERLLAVASSTGRQR